MAWFLASSYYTLEYVLRSIVCTDAGYVTVRFFLFMKYEFSVVDNVKKSFGTDAISKKSTMIQKQLTFNMLHFPNRWTMRF